MTLPRARSRTARRLLLAVAIAAIALQVGGTLPLAVVALGGWLAALALGDPGSLKRLWRPKFWAVTLVIAAASGLLLGPRDLDLLGLRLSRTGLEAGALMVVRGAFLFALATWASRAVSGAGLQRAAARVGLPHLGRAVATAFELLPTLDERLRGAHRTDLWGATPDTSRLGRGYAAAVGLVYETARLAEEMTAPPAADAPRGTDVTPPASRRRPLLLAIVGPPGTGKTQAIAAVAAALAARGWAIGGVMQPAIGAPGARTGYRLRDLATGEERPLAERRPGLRLGFDFDPEAWRWAFARIASARRTADVVVVDELGRLEAQGDGHLPALLADVPDERARVWVLGVRESSATPLVAALGAFTWTIAADGGALALEPILAAVEEHLRG